MPVRNRLWDEEGGGVIAPGDRLMPVCSRCGVRYEYDATTLVMPGDDPQKSGTFVLCDNCQAFTRPAGVAS